GDKKAEPLLVKLLASPAPDVRALAAVGLGLTRDRKHVPALAALARSPEAGASARAAATHALGELGGGADPALYLSLAAPNETMLRQAALPPMARPSWKEDAGPPPGPAEAIAAGIFSSDAPLRDASSLAATALATKSYRRAREALPVPGGPLTIRDVLLGL